MKLKELKYLFLPQRRTRRDNLKRKLKKKKGYVLLPVFALFTFMLIFILFMFVFTKYKIVSEGEISSNALNASNLAALSLKNIDMDSFLQNPDENLILIKDPNMALRTWEEHLKYNFSLDNTYEPKYKSNFIKSKVDIREFIIYNVNNVTNDVTKYEFNTNTHEFKETDYPNGKGNILTPKGNKVNVTTIHSKIGFTIEGMLNNSKQYVEVSEDNGAYKK